MVTGTSVLGLKYKDGVMLAADNLGASDLFILFLIPMSTCEPIR